MSIATKTGDDGSTGLMFNRRVSKCHPRVEACGAVDELNAALGLARASSRHAFSRDAVAAVQKDLVTVMGELATDSQDALRYVRSGYPVVTAEMTGGLDQQITNLEALQIVFQGWATPGASIESAALDLARTACRRAERRICAILESGQVINPHAVTYLNRLSDCLWLLARWVEAQPPDPPSTAPAGPSGTAL